MNSLNDLSNIDLLDDIDNLLFLCNRLNNRLLQVTSYIDEVKQTWLTKRRAVEFDSSPSPIVAQKASKCNKVLLNVAEKLAVVELQTESLHNLQSSIANLLPPSTEKREVCSSVPSFNQTPVHSSSSRGQITPLKNESVLNGFISQRHLSSTTGRSSGEPRVNTTFQSPINIGTNTSTNTFTARNSSTLFSDTVAVKQPTEQFQLQQQQSAFHRPVVAQETSDITEHKLSSQISHYDPLKRPTPNGLINGYHQPSSNVVIPRPIILSDSSLSGTLNDSNGTNYKVRVKMQVIKAGSIWQNADVPIIDHPSAFFVFNQDPRVAEQFHMMSTEMNNCYNKPASTTVPLHNPSIGDFCVARFSEDQHWYRARVVLIHGNDSILIVFIDYGNSETKPANEIYPMQESLARLPAMTVACTLAESFPRDEMFWTTQATEIFTMLVKNRIVEVHFQQGSGQQWPLHFVKIMLDGKSIAQHPKLAAYITPTRNEQIALHFNDKLTSMEYILYNVAVVESDIYSGSLP